MRLGIRESARALLLAGFLAGGGALGVACGGDDDGGGGTPDSGVTPVPTGTTTSAPDAAPPPPPPPADAGADTGPSVTAAAPTFNPAAGTFTTPQSVEISTSTAGATIFYTTDGTNPTTSSVVYSAPIAVAQTTTIRAFATAPGFKDSPVSSATYTINIPPGTTAPVQFNPAAGTHPNTVNVGLSSTTENATICYTTDNSAPGCTNGVCSGTSATYNAANPVVVATAGTTIRALACKVGNTNSAETSATYQFQAAAATTDVAPGEVPYNQPVVISSITNGATIHYTTDGSTPNCFTPTTIANPTQVNITQNVTYRTIVCKAGYQASTVGVHAFTVRLGTPTLNAGTYNNNTAAQATPANDPASGVAVTYCYAAGATTPVCNAAGNGCTTGNTSLTVTQTNTTVNVVGCAPNYTPSNVVTGVFNLKVAPVAVNGPNNPGGYVPTTSANYWDGTAPDAFNLQTATTGETIRYSTDGSDVTCTQACAGNASCTVCTPGGGGCSTGPLAAFTTLKARGCRANYD